jgi:hypothetical protein
MAQTVLINCGCVEFVVNKETLLHFPDSMLAKRFCGSWDSNSNFIDRDPIIFRLVLDYYRDLSVIIPYNIPIERVILEFEFYCLPTDHLENTVVDYSVIWKKRNIKINTINTIFDNIIGSEWFYNSMKDNIKISWYVGDPIIDFEYYDIFTNSYQQIYTYMKEYVYKKYKIFIIINTCYEHPKHIYYYSSKAYDDSCVKKVCITKPSICITFTLMKTNDPN